MESVALRVVGALLYNFKDLQRENRQNAGHDIEDNAAEKRGSKNRQSRVGHNNGYLNPILRKWADQGLGSRPSTVKHIITPPTV